MCVCVCVFLDRIEIYIIGLSLSYIIGQCNTIWCCSNAARTASDLIKFIVVMWIKCTYYLVMHNTFCCKINILETSIFKYCDIMNTTIIIKITCLWARHQAVYKQEFAYGMVIISENLCTYGLRQMPDQLSARNLTRSCAVELHIERTSATRIHHNIYTFNNILFIFIECVISEYHMKAVIMYFSNYCEYKEYQCRNDAHYVAKTGKVKVWCTNSVRAYL